MEEDKKEAFVTLATSDFYAQGCLVLGHALREQGTRKQLVALLTEDVSWGISRLLEEIFDVTERMPRVDSELSHLSATPEIVSEPTKLRCWRLTQFKKCVFLSSDSLILQNCDELFDRDELSAAPDANWPDCFGTSVFVFVPSMETYWDLVNLARKRGRIDGGDDQILNERFNEIWRNDLGKRLSFVYHLVCSSVYSYVPALRHYGASAKIVQFAGQPKPWMVPWNIVNGRIEPDTPLNACFVNFYQKWLDIFKDKVYPKLPEHCRSWTAAERVVPVFDILSKLKTFAHSSASSGFPTEMQDVVRNVTPFIRLHSLPESSFPPPELKVVQTTDSRAFSPVTDIHDASRVCRENSDIPSEAEQKFVADTLNVSETSVAPRRVSPVSPVLENIKSLEEMSAAMIHTESSSSFFHSEFSSGVGEDVEDIEDMSNASLSSLLLTKSSSKTDEERLQQWEKGKADYMGQDTFDNIWKRLSSFIDVPNRSESKTTCGDAPSLVSRDSQSISPSSTSPTPLLEGDKINDTFLDFEELGKCLSAETMGATGRLPGYAVGDYERMHQWEKGNIDFTGRDSSDNIMRRLDFLIYNEDYNLS